MIIFTSIVYIYTGSFRTKIIEIKDEILPLKGAFIYLEAFDAWSD